MPDYSDIPEPFRRAFEDEEHRQRQQQSGQPPKSDGGSNAPPPPRPRNVPRPWWQNRNSWFILALVLLFVSFDWIVATYVDWLWFIERDYVNVWSTQLIARATTFFTFFFISAAILLISWHTARRRSSRMTIPYASGGANIQIPGLGLVTTVTGLFLSVIFASAMATRWDTFLLYFNRTSFGKVDPIFGRDISFYVFELPVYNLVQGWLLPLILFSLMGSLAFYAIRLLPSLQGGNFNVRDIPTPMRRTVAILGAFFFTLWAIGYWLQTYDLLFSDRGVVFGAGYTDVNATLYALYAQMVAAIILVVTLIYNYFRLELRPLAVAGLIWLVAIIIVGGIYPAILQNFVVVPNELEREREFIRDNIDYTRQAFGLDEVEERPFGRVDVLVAEDLTDNQDALKNVRLWDYRPLQDTYEELQALRPYYQFSDIDIDRYEINGETRQVMLAPRELDKTQLPNDTWVNQKLEFTHGYGVVMNPVDRFTSQGRPEFFISDLPTISNVDIPIDRPEIYYGEATSDVIFAGSDVEEFSYPNEPENVYTRYNGSGGVPMGGQLRQLALAYHFGETNLLFSDAIKEDTRVMYYRNVQDRVRQIAPFLTLDHDPYLVINNGRLVWIQDAYTTSAGYPYSQPISHSERFGTSTVSHTFNYIRNSVKITVDAYNGEVNFYLVNPENDPIIQAYNTIYPDLFQPFSDLPESLIPHLRYPEDLFVVQTKQYLVYHMTDEQIFYTKEDEREIPRELFEDSAQLLEPYYVMFTLPGETETEYLLIQPYTPKEKDNMIAWIAARNDPEHYGELVAYEFPKQSLVVGPFQIEGFIDQEPEISQQFSLWNQNGSKIIRGNLIVIPLNDSFLYVEPIYLESETSALPELKRVIVASGQQIIMRETLGEALDALLDGTGSILDLPAEDTTVNTADDTETDINTAESTDTVAPVATDASVTELIDQANAQFAAAQAAQQAGDWAEYGIQIEALEQTLQQLEAAQQ